MYLNDVGTGTMIIIMISAAKTALPETLLAPKMALAVFCAAARGAATPAAAVWLTATAARPALTGTTAGSASCWPCSSPLSQEKPGSQKKNGSAATGRSRRRTFFKSF